MIGYVLLGVCFLVIAMMWTEGMWTNAITLCNVVFAGLVSWNLYEFVAGYLEKNVMGSYTYVVDFLAFWVLFVFIFNAFRAITDAISNTKVRFKKPIEVAGGIIFALLTAWVMVCIICASLHMAPLSKSPFRGSFAKEPMSNCFFGLSPDRYWLAFVHSRSKKALSTKSKNVFDPQGEFILKYGTRRKNLTDLNLQQDGAIRVKNRR